MPKKKKKKYFAQAQAFKPQSLPKKEDQVIPEEGGDEMQYLKKDLRKVFLSIFGFLLVFGILVYLEARFLYVTELAKKIASLLIK